MLAGNRKLGRHNLSTPILVPSYSSHGFLGQKAKFDQLSKYTSRRCLISAYDVHYAILPPEALFAADLLILDSGGYEAYASSELSTPKAWNVEMYEEVLRLAAEGDNVLSVSFDYNTRGWGIERQIAECLALSGKYPQLDWDFLVKPFGFATKVDSEGLLDHSTELESFAAIGFVEEELGDSLSERAGTIARVRTNLRRLGLDQPIHVFGCLDPMTVPIYFAAGADVFDGLEWLRWSFTLDGPARVSTQLIRSGRLSRNFDEEAILASVNNLQVLEVLVKRLESYARSGDITVLGLPEAATAQLSELLADVS